MPWIGALSSLWNQAKLYKLRLSGVSMSSGICLVCGGLDADNSGVCDGCLADFPRRREPRLIRNIAFVEVAFAAYRYEFPITSLIKSAKFHADFGALALLRAGFAQTLEAHLGEIDFLVPVPLSLWRFMQRGFNQAGELARGLGEASGKPVHYGLVTRRHGRSAPQSRLGAAARHENIKGAFRVTAQVRGARVAIIDDVITTGATCSSVAAVLKAAGAARIIAVAVAATPRRHEDGHEIRCRGW